jgi:acyl carrier protein
MSSTLSGELSFDQFKKILAEELLVSEAKLVPEASFITDLAVDSIRLVEMILRFEELGVRIPAELAWQIQTVGDAYKYFVENRVS